MKYKKKIVLSVATALILTNSIYAKDITNLDTVTVTAQKKAENIQDVPISMTLLDEISIVDNNIELIEDIAAYTPNLMFFSFGLDTQTSPSLRGIYSDLDSKTSSMAIYIDGVPILVPLNNLVQLNNTHI